MASGLSQASSSCPPLGLAYLAASLKQAGHRVNGIDSIGEAPSQFTSIGRPGFLCRGLTPKEIHSRSLDYWPDLIGISVMFTHEWPMARKTIELLRQAHQSAWIVAGGEHVTAAPEFCLEDCPEIDACVCGEGEQAMLDIAAYCTDRIVRRARIRDIDSIPGPEWTVFPIEPYLDNGLGFGVNRGRSMPILATRGCPYECTFCSSPQMWTTKWQARRPEFVLDEMEDAIRRYRVTNFDFYDLTAIIKRDWIIEFSKKVIARNIQCTWQLPSGTRSEALDRDALDVMSAAGCRDVSYAPESGSEATLKRIKKKVFLPRMLDSMKAAVSTGMDVKANIIIGFPEDTHRDILKTFLFILRMARAGVHDIHLNGYLAYPGTELFNQLNVRMNDDYCYGLIENNSTVTAGRSHSEHISNQMLAIYRFLGLALFYGVRYLLRPRDLYRMTRNIYRGHEETRGQHEIINMIRRGHT
jgi:radical SAM superfamily enzyme YgiQ (UPF0313 family)